MNSTFRLRVIAPDRLIWDSKAEEIILTTNTGKVGILPNHAPLLTGLDIGILKIRTTESWSVVAVMGGFAMIHDNDITILVNEAENAKEINLQEAQETFQLAQSKVSQADGRKQTIEANLNLKRAKARLEAIEEGIKEGTAN
jgi:F-type H+-transporting ATPase subunit epsilon|uniref:AtpE n=1 Tax=Funaria hygrometrica TaxID=29583 RepID=UPI001D113096|nr:AtpE [Funaria hygrometrica]QZJ47578.1 AtpE [Funaria hygrometrica]